MFHAANSFFRSLLVFHFIFQSTEHNYPGLLSIIPVLIMTSFFALIAYNGPRFAIETGQPFHMPPGESILWGFLALQISSSVFPRVLKR